jgi:hypothetical protein
MKRKVCTKLKNYEAYVKIHKLYYSTHNKFLYSIKDFHFHNKIDISIRVKLYSQLVGGVSRNIINGIATGIVNEKLK